MFPRYHLEESSMMHGVDLSREVPINNLNRPFSFEQSLSV